MDKESYRTRVALLKATVKQRTKEQKAAYEREVLSDILLIEKQDDPIELRYGLKGILDRLESIGISEEDAIIKIRAFTTNTNILACLNDNPETSISQN